MLGRWLPQRLAGGGRHAHVDACAHSRRRIWVAHRRATAALLLLVLGARWPSLLVSGLARRLRVGAPMGRTHCVTILLSPVVTPELIPPFNLPHEPLARERHANTLIAFADPSPSDHPTVCACPPTPTPPHTSSCTATTATATRLNDSKHPNGTCVRRTLSLFHRSANGVVDKECKA